MKKNILAENMRRFGTKNLVTEDFSKRVGYYYKVGGVRLGSESTGHVMVKLWLRDSGNGEEYIQAKAEGSTFAEAYAAAAESFRMQRDSVKTDPVHVEYARKDRAMKFEAIQPVTLEELS